MCVRWKGQWCTHVWVCLNLCKNRVLGSTDSLERKIIHNDGMFLNTEMCRIFIVQGYCVFVSRIQIDSDKTTALKLC